MLTTTFGGKTTFLAKETWTKLLNCQKNILEDVLHSSQKNIRPVDDRKIEQLTDDDFISIDDRTQQELEDDD